MLLYLIRHPQPAIAPNLCYGGTDVSVAEEHAESAARALAEALPKQAPIYSSPLSRCAGLAEKLAPLVGSSPPVYDSRLAEMHFGNWEMQSWEDVPRMEIDAWAENIPHFRPGGGETVAEVARRVVAFERELKSLTSGSAIVICHAGTIRLLLACRHEKDPEQIALLAARNDRRVAFGECIIVEY